MNNGGDQDIRVVLGAIVRKYRRAAGLSQTQLADAIGSIQGYISNLERGRENPGIVTVDQLARALGRPFDIAKAWPETRGGRRRRI